MPIAVSKSTKEKYILLIKNYRPPIDRFCIELPGGSCFESILLKGLLDENETAEDAALRELKEETGYSGVVLSEFASPLLPVCPGTGSENTSIIPVLVSDSTQLLLNRLIMTVIKSNRSNNRLMRMRWWKRCSFHFIHFQRRLKVAFLSTCDG